MSHWANDSGSLFILGRTQTGKTTAAKEIHAENDRISIWVNQRGEDRIRGVSGNRYESLDGVKSGLARNERKFNLLSGDPKRDVQALKEFAWSAAERTDRSLPWQIVIDEIQNTAPQTQERELEPRDSIRQIAKEGQKRNIRVVGITQDPVSMDKQTLRQREYLLTFDLSKEQRDVITDYVNRPEIINQQPEYAGVLWHANGQALFEGVKAKARYG